jgi:hypothetical protein
MFYFRSALLGKVLRIDINTEHLGPSIAYAIPPDNPFLGHTHFRREIYEKHPMYVIVVETICLYPNLIYKNVGKIV